jgi:hypothetical protein
MQTRRTAPDVGDILELSAAMLDLVIPALEAVELVATRLDRSA